MDEIKVLLIDDDIKFLELVKLNLEDTGEFKVRTERNGTVGINAAMIFQPDIILLDIVMGDTDGSYIAKQLKENDKTKNIPIVYLSGILEEKEEKNSNGFLGGYPCLSKPAATDKIIRCIKKNIKK